MLGECGALREVMHPRSLSLAVAAGHHPCCSGTARSHKTPQTLYPHVLSPSHKQRSTGVGLTLPHHDSWGKRWGPLAGISKPRAPTGQGRVPRCPAVPSWCLLHCISWGSSSAPLCPAAPTPHRAMARGGGDVKIPRAASPLLSSVPAGWSPRASGAQRAPAHPSRVGAGAPRAGGAAGKGPAPGAG